jgi:hypothetical protein
VYFSGQGAQAGAIQKNLDQLASKLGLSKEEQDSMLQEQVKSLG